MIDYIAARELVARVLAEWGAASPHDAWVILDEHTIERDWGWVFFYDSLRYRETKDILFAVAGNAPYFVRRDDGAVLVSGTALPVEQYIEDFEASGCRTIHST